MKSTGTIFLTKSRHGIWYYQRWIPIYFCKHNPTLNKVLRVSLRTRNIRHAKQLSRFTSVKFDELTSQFFDNPKDFGKAMELLLKSIKTWETYPEYLDYEEHFLSHLEEDTIDEFLFLKAEKFSSQVQKEIENLQKENLALQELIKGGNLSSSQEDIEELLKRIYLMVNPLLSEDENPTLRVVYNEWHKVKRKSMRTASLNDAYATPINLFIAYLEYLNGHEIRVNEISIDEVLKFKKFLGTLPLRIITKSQSIKELFVKLHPKLAQ